MAKNSQKNVARTKVNNTVSIPRWLIIVVPLVIAILGVVIIYNSFASQAPVSPEWKVTDVPNANLIYCNSSNECYTGPLTNTIAYKAYVRNTKDSTCISGFQWSNTKDASEDKWSCVLTAGD